MIVLYDKRLPEEYKKAIDTQITGLLWLEFNISSENSVYPSILYHPDIYFFQLNNKSCIYAPCIEKDLIDRLNIEGVNTIEGSGSPAGNYPFSAQYNAVRVGDFLLCNLKCVDPAIIDAAKKNDLKTINVPQGYTRCSIIPVGKNAVITSDNGINKAALKNGLDTLLIQKGSVILPGQKHGFIGGATGVTIEGTIVFLGDVNLHPDGKSIINFLNKHNAKYTTAKNLPLYDAGTLMFFDL